MTRPTTQRVRDPIHNLIIFDERDEVDQLAWRLINTPEFQRLRRIRQLGVSEFVFPGATHTRFAHSLGVYHNARRLLGIIETLNGGQDERRAKVIRLAALLHDIGHGPFSHTFEGARRALLTQKGREADYKKHEYYSAEIIRNPSGAIAPLLSAIDPALPAEIAAVIEADDPSDIYHAVISSSFDADRLDYLARDRYMTGTHAGAVDTEWLFDSLIIEDIPLSGEGETDDLSSVPTFAFSEKGRAAAEDFLLARYRLYSTVYMHKTTRGFEQVLRALLCWLGEPAHAAASGLDDDHPLIRLLTADGVGEVQAYAQMDDVMVWGVLERLHRKGADHPRALARRLLHRQRLRCLDVSAHHPSSPAMVGSTDKKLRHAFEAQLDVTVFRDTPTVSVYSALDGKPAKAHKVIRMRTTEGLQEITRFPDTLIGKGFEKPKTLFRYYFFKDEDYLEAERIAKTGR